MVVMIRDKSFVIRGMSSEVFFFYSGVPRYVSGVGAIWWFSNSVAVAEMGEECGPPANVQQTRTCTCCMCL